MLVEGEGGGIPGYSNWTSRGRNVEGESKWSPELTSTKKYEESTKVPSVTNFVQTVTLGILDQFQQSKWPPKALKKTFQTVSKMSQGDQYSLSY